MYLLIKFKNTFQRNTKNTDRNGVNEQKEKDFPSLYMGKCSTPFLENFWKRKPPLFYNVGVTALMKIEKKILTRLKTIF